MTGLAPRHEFALLRDVSAEKPLVYLDSAASALSPDMVLEHERRFRERTAGNVHRGSHAQSEAATAAYAAARVRVARFLNADPASVVFVRGATEGINLVARGLRLSKSDLVLTTTAEHHSNLVPWMREARVAFVRSDSLAPLDPGALRDAMRSQRPRVLAVQHASNVTGLIQPVADLCRVARELGVISVVDAAQSAPHLSVDVRQLGCDFLAFSGHKVLGPKGIGVLWGRTELLATLEPLVVGGGSVQSVDESGFVLRPPPEGLEAGTPNVGGAVGLAAALDYLAELGPDTVAAHSRRLASALCDALSRLPFERVLAARDPERLPIASVVLRAGGITADQLAVMLSDTFGIMTRSGLQCAHPLFAELGAREGALRISAYVYNDEQDIGYFETCCRQILERLGA